MTERHTMTLTLTRRGTGYQVHDLDTLEAQPLALFNERWQAIEFMRRNEKIK